VPRDLLALFVLDDKELLLLDVAALLVTHTRVKIRLRMNQYLLAALEIFEANLIRPAAPFAAVCFDDAFGFCGDSATSGQLSGIESCWLMLYSSCAEL
jgi:hypothetical protein